VNEVVKAASASTQCKHARAHTNNKHTDSLSHSHTQLNHTHLTVRVSLQTYATVALLHTVLHNARI